MDRAVMQNRIASPLITTGPPHTSPALDILLTKHQMRLDVDSAHMKELSNEPSLTLSSSKLIELRY